MKSGVWYIKKYVRWLFLTVFGFFLPVRTGLNGLDEIIETYVSYDGGVFVEAGANDGINQSNTYYLERYRGWTGLLIEPVPALATLARRFRTSTVVECALGDSPSADCRQSILAGDLRSAMMELALVGSDQVRAIEHVMKDAESGAKVHEVSVTVRTLSGVLDESGIKHLNLLSLDVEGFELAALRGIDMSRHRPDVLVVETEDVEAVKLVIGSQYQHMDKVSVHDYVFYGKPKG